MNLFVSSNSPSYIITYVHDCKPRVKCQKVHPLQCAGRVSFQIYYSREMEAGSDGLRVSGGKDRVGGVGRVKGSRPGPPEPSDSPPTEWNRTHTHARTHTVRHKRMSSLKCARTERRRFPGCQGASLSRLRRASFSGKRGEDELKWETDHTIHVWL